VKTKRPTWNSQLLRDDAAARGWNNLQLAKEAGVAVMSVTRAYRGEASPKMMRRFALAIGKPVSRYLIRAAEPQKAVA
jgi:hypothetical protein